MSQPNFFSQLASEKRTAVMDLLLKTGSDLRIKIREQHYKSKILSKISDGVYSIYKFIPGNFKEQEGIFSFDTTEGKYFFRGSISTQGSNLTLKTPDEIFQMVRRNDFRVDVPSSNDYICEIIDVNDVLKSVPAKLRNISLGGCQISVPTDSVIVNKEDTVSIKLGIKNYEWDLIATVAKQVRPAEKENALFLGLQFKEPEADFLTEVQSSLIFLDRTHRHARNE